MLAPIVLFVYNRPLHFVRVIQALRNNKLAKESELIIYSDAPKDESEVQRVKEVRNLIANIDGFKNITVILRDVNLGLSRSIISGVTEVLEKYDRVIVLEDDLVASPFFLDFMNAGLEKYSDNTQVVCVHGYVYPCHKPLPANFFIRGADCWGWGTWRDSWSIFNPDGLCLLDELKRLDLMSEFDFSGAYSFSQMLKNQISGKNDSWAIRWHASAFIKNKLTLYPGRSLISNIGNDGSGSHKENSQFFDTNATSDPIYIEDICVVESTLAKNLFAKYFLGIQKTEFNSFIRRVANFFGIKK